MDYSVRIRFGRPVKEIRPLLPADLNFLSSLLIDDTTGDRIVAVSDPDRSPVATATLVQRLEEWGRYLLESTGEAWMKMITLDVTYSEQDLQTSSLLEISSSTSNDVMFPLVTYWSGVAEGRWECGTCSRIVWKQTQDLTIENVMPGVDFQKTELNNWLVSNIAGKILVDAGITQEGSGISLRPLANLSRYKQLVIENITPLVIVPPLKLYPGNTGESYCPECGEPYNVSLDPFQERVIGADKKTGMIFGTQMSQLTVIKGSGPIPMLSRSKWEASRNNSPQDVHEKGSLVLYKENPREQSPFDGFFFASQEFYQLVLKEGLTGLCFEPTIMSGM